MSIASFAVLTFVRGVYDEYHRYTVRNDRLDKVHPFTQLQMPRTDEGGTLSLIYGRCLVRSPVCAWIGGLEQTETFDSEADVDGVYFYRAKMFFVIGIPFSGGIQKVHAIYDGETRLHGKNESPTYVGSPNTGTASLSDLLGTGNFEPTGPAPVGGDPESAANRARRGSFAGANTPAGRSYGYLEFLNGSSSQQLIDPITFLPLTVAGENMLLEIAPSFIPAYRGFLSAFLFARTSTPGPSPGFPNRGWVLDKATELPAIGFEVSSYPGQEALVSSSIGDDCNPMDVLRDVLDGELGKLGMPASLIDVDSFREAAQILHAESHSYSRSIEGASAREVVGEIMEQVDGVLYDDPASGTLKVKLIRPDFDVLVIPHITPDNCERLEGFTIRGLTGLPNKVRLNYTSRMANYQERSATAHNQANAVGQDGLVSELSINMPGVCTAALAESLAARELAANSRPVMVCRAIVDRGFGAVFPGFAVFLSWPEYHVSNVVFRVANVDRGGPQDNTIAFDLIQDFSYVHRMVVYGTNEVAPFPGAAEILQ
ncbi:MAG: hypothetical protein H0T42_28750 [Deltaproteobacteria bacterium]|nr:hypothetical protein [Deltaproteobacteria bacterium]